METRHPGDQPTTVLEAMEIFSAGQHRGERFSEGDLDAMARASRECGFDAPLRLAAGEDALLKPEAAPSFGWLTNVRREGSRLVADAVGVPRKLADLIAKGAYTEISTEIYDNYKISSGRWPRVVRSVVLSGGQMPRVGSLADLEKLYSRTDEAGREYRIYCGRVIPLGDVDDAIAYDDDAGASCAEDSTMPVNYEDLSVEDQCDLTRQVVDHQVRSYMRAHAGVGYAEALAATLQADPHLKQRYATSWIPLPAGNAPSADWHQAGLEILRLADAYQQKHPELSRTDVIHAVFRDKDNAVLIRRYARGSTPPGT